MTSSEGSPAPREADGLRGERGFFFCSDPRYRAGTPDLGGHPPQAGRHTGNSFLMNGMVRHVGGGVYTVALESSEIVEASLRGRLKLEGTRRGAGRDR